MKATQFSFAGLSAARLLLRMSPVMENMASTCTLKADGDKYSILQQAAMIQSREHECSKTTSIMSTSRKVKNANVTSEPLSRIERHEISLLCVEFENFTRKFWLRRMEILWWAGNSFFGRFLWFNVGRNRLSDNRQGSSLLQSMFTARTRSVFLLELQTKCLRNWWFFVLQNIITSSISQAFGLQFK